MPRSVGIAKWTLIQCVSQHWASVGLRPPLQVPAGHEFSAVHIGGSRANVYRGLLWHGSWRHSQGVPSAPWRPPRGVGEQNGWLGVARPSLGLCHCPHPRGLAYDSFLSPNGDLLGDAQHWCLRKGETVRAQLKRLCVKRAESVAGNKFHSKQVGGGGPQRAHRTPPCAQGPVGSITQSASRCILAIGSYVCELSVGHRVAVWSPPRSRSLVLFQRPPGSSVPLRVSAAESEAARSP